MKNYLKLLGVRAMGIRNIIGTMRLYSNLWINVVSLSRYFNFRCILCSYSICLTIRMVFRNTKGFPYAIGRWLLPGTFALVMLHCICNYQSRCISLDTNDYLMLDKSDPRYDYVIDGKKAYLNSPLLS